MSARIAVVFGQFGKLADPVNLPAFQQRLQAASVQTILVQHTDSQSVYDFLHGFRGFIGIIGASLGAGAGPIMAGYLGGSANVGFVGGFQPSDWDPVMHEVSIQCGDDVITRAVSVPANVANALCFRNPVVAATGGLGHATYVLAPGNTVTELSVIERNDVHPGDFGVAQDIMFTHVMALINKGES